MKNKLSNIAVVAFTLLLSAYSVSSVRAEQLIVPIISKPLYLEEGVERNLTQSQVDELLPWAKNSKISLVELLEDIREMSINDKINHLTNGIASVVKESSPTSELLMRYILNRALILQNTIKKETDESAVGIADVKLRILLSSVNMAIKYYDIDTKMLNNKSNMTFAAFGANYFTFLVELNKSVFDASAQYSMHKITLEWLAWDLYRDFENKAYAVQIIKINNFLKTLPQEKISDTQSLVYIRKMRNLEEKLEMGEIVQKIIDKSPSRELKIGERVLTKNRVTGILRSASIYANVSDSATKNGVENKNSHYCVKFTTPSVEERFMAYDNFVKRSDILLASGCGEMFCVGEQVIESKTRDVFTIIGIDVNGDYAIRANDREMTGLQDRDLLKIKK